MAGAQDCVAQGVFSSLQPANLRLKRAVANEGEAMGHASYPLLFDPQTAGGLIGSVPADAAERCIAELKQLGYTEAAVIGEVTSAIDANACSVANIYCLP